MRTIGGILIVWAVACSMAHAQQAVAQNAVSEQQRQWKSDYLLRVSQFIHGYDKQQMFAKWIRFGKTAKFRERLNQANVSIAVEPGLHDIAEYRTGPQTIVIKSPPAEFGFSLQSTGKSSLLLWHEAIHAISHGHQVGAITPSHPLRGAPAALAPTAQGKITAIGKAEGMIDHYYINWAESCAAATKYLIRLETILKQNGKEKPTGRVKDLAQKNWKAFVRDCNFSIFGQVPDDKERKELETMIGFHCDPAEVLNGYLGLGYPMEYFGDYVTDDQVWALFPTAAHVGAVGLKVGKDKNMMDNLAAIYVKSWGSGTSGRNCAIHLTLFGSPEISTIVWDAMRKAIRYKMTAIPGVGEAAYLYHRGQRNGDHGVAKFWNAHILIVDLDIVKESEKGPISVRKRAINWNLAKRIFMNMEAMGVPPVPAGVETSAKKLMEKSGG